MNIPENIKVGYKDYKVVKVNNLDDGTNLLFGEVTYVDEVIKLANKYPENQMKLTLIHELVHAVDDMLGIDLKEEQVVKLGTGLYQVIKDNPDMFRVTE
ncbi:MAG: hypothetical protein K0R46_2010 [Herbinix sp.]|nr:hypothetical protein [Herbinix sp.]